MDQASAFLQDVVAHPDDDAPRLVYADWLEEQGDASSWARAEFIRVQYALAGLPRGDIRRAPLEQRQRDLLLAHEQQWTDGLSELGVQGRQFRRGFVERITIHPGQLIEFGDRLRARVPLRELNLTGQLQWPYPRHTAINLDALAQLPLLDQITALHVVELQGSGANSSSPVPLLQSPRLARLTELSILLHRTVRPVLARAPYLPHLKTLRVGGYHLDSAAGFFFRKANLSGLTRLELHLLNEGAPSDLHALARSPHLTRLEELSLADCRVSARLGDLAGGRFPRLRLLDLGNTRLGSVDLRVLLAGPLLQSVEVLDLPGNPLREVGAALLAGAESLTRLRRLDLTGNSLGPRGASLLARAPNLPALESMHLRTNGIGDEGLAALAGGLLLHLRALNVSYNGITAQGLRALADNWSGRLTALDLSWNRLHEEGVLVLTACPGLDSLTALNLSYCELGDRAAVALAECPGLSNLAALDLGTNRIGDEGLTALAHSPHLRALRSLHLGNTAVGDKGAAALLESSLLSRLEVLAVGGSGVGPEMRQELRSAFRGILG